MLAVNGYLFYLQLQKNLLSDIDRYRHCSSINKYIFILQKVRCNTYILGMYKVYYGLSIFCIIVYSLPNQTLQITKIKYTPLYYTKRLR